MKKIIAILLFCGLTTFAQAQNDLTKQDKQTIQAFVSALKSWDIDKIANLISYDFNNIEAGGKKLKIKDKEAFKKNADKILTKKRGAAIVNAKLSDWERIGAKGFSLQTDQVTIWSDEDGKKIVSIF